MIKSAKIRLLLKALALLLRAARALLLAAAERAAAPETLPFFCGLPKAPAPFLLCLSINVPLSRRQPHKLHLLTLESATPSPLNTSQTFSEPLSPGCGLVISTPQIFKSSTGSIELPPLRNLLYFSTISGSPSMIFWLIAIAAENPVAY